MSNRIRTFPLLVITLLMPAFAGAVFATDEKAGSLAGIQISFKLDPRLSGSTYGGERWVSPPTFQGATAQDTVEARVRGVDANGRSVPVSPSWVPSDPEMVTVSPAQGESVKITVKRAGQCKLKVTSQDISKELNIKAESRNGFLLVEIAQGDGGKPAADPPRTAADEYPRTAEIQAEATGTQGPSKADRALAASQIAEKNRKDGEAFLAANKEKEGVVTLESGLQYRILRTGSGEKPGLGDVVFCQYRGSLIDGTEFASSYKKKRPAKLLVGGVNRGLAEALQLMPVGSRWQIFVPAELAYGVRGFPRARIGPNMALIFDVDLMAIKPKSGDGPAPQAQPVTVLRSSSRP